MTTAEWLKANPFHYKFQSEDLTFRLTVCACDNQDHVLIQVTDDAGLGQPIKKAARGMEVATGTILTVACTLLASLGLEECWELTYRLVKWRRKWQEETGNHPIYLPKDAVVN